MTYGNKHILKYPSTIIRESSIYRILPIQGIGSKRIYKFLRFFLSPYDRNKNECNA